jgi:two-component system CheB/CheR fusion protein
MAIAAAQDVLSAASSEGADLHELITELASTLAPDRGRLEIEGAPVRLAAGITTPFALILHELATNALKYGAWSQDSGKVQVSWSLAEGTLSFRWRERDGPVIAPPMREGLGRTLIKSSLPGATVSHDLKADGLECRIELPLVNQT